MGYTHYWNRKVRTTPATQEEWDNLTAFARKLFNQHESILAGSFGDKGTKPTLDSSGILFNGIEELAHETFAFSRNPDDDIPDYKQGKADDEGYKYFSFCKTARKPYDIVVVAILKRAERLGLIEFSSDGEEEDLQAGIELEKNN